MAVLTCRPAFSYVCLILFCLGFLFTNTGLADESDNEKQPGKPDAKWKKKDVRDYSDADMQRLFDQWEEAEEDQDPDDLPEHKRPLPEFDMTKLDPKKPEEMIKMTKKGRTLMMFVTVSGNPSRKETEEITVLWQSMLFNAHFEMTRYVIADDRVILVLKDGSNAWDIKNFLVEQERCEEVTFENQNFPGAAQIARLKAEGGDTGKKEEKEKKEEKDKKGKSKKSKKKDKKSGDDKKKADKDSSKKEGKKVKTEL